MRIVISHRLSQARFPLVDSDVRITVMKRTVESMLASQKAINSIKIGSVFQWLIN